MIETIRLTNATLIVFCSTTRVSLTNIERKIWNFQI